MIILKKSILFLGLVIAVGFKVTSVDAQTCSGSVRCYGYNTDGFTCNLNEASTLACSLQGSSCTFTDPGECCAFGGPGCSGTSTGPTGTPPPAEANPTCWAGEVFVPDDPPVILCYDTDVPRFNEGACRFQGDGTGGRAGQNIGFANCGGLDTGFWCQLGYCAAGCNCTWVNNACGSVTNGCAYETMQQVQSCTPAGCSNQTQCVPNIACSWPGTVRGVKVLMPGNVMGVAGIENQVVTMDASSTTTNPYYFNLADTNAGVVHTVSVLPNPAYDIGSTTCYNTTACHTDPAFPIAPGNSVQVTDDGLRSSGANFANPYVGVWWHYCPKLTAVQNLNPTSVCVPTGGSTPINIMWVAPASGNPDAYRVQLIENGVMIVNIVIPSTSTSYPVNVTAGRSYVVNVIPRNECEGSGPWATVSFTPVGPPSGPGVVTATDIGGGVQIDWQNLTNGTGFRVYKNTSTTLLHTVGNVKQDLDLNNCIGGPIPYYVEAYDNSRPVGCQASAKQSGLATCTGFNVSWWAASGGGNLVSAQSTLRSQVPPTVYNPYLISNAEGLFPGLGIGVPIHTDLSGKVNDRNWLYNTTTGWSVSNILTDRENTYDGMKERIWSRTKPTPVSAFPIISDLSYPAVPTTISGVNVAYHSGNVTLGPLNMSGKKLLLFVEGNVTIADEITWSSATPGFLAVIARGNIAVSPNVGTTGLTMDVDVRPWNVPANISGIYYAGGMFSTGAAGGATRDKILKIDGTVIGMSGVNLQRNNVGRYPVEFFNYQPSLVRELTEVGLRRKIVRELLNP